MFQLYLTLESYSPLHLISPFGGPLLAITMGCIYCFYPMKDIRFEPDYWYELQLLLIPGFFPLFLCSGLVEGAYWCNFKYNGNLKSYAYTFMFGLTVYGVVNTVYYLVWVQILGWTPPMAFNNYVAGTSAWNSHHIFIWSR